MVRARRIIVLAVAVMLMSVGLAVPAVAGPEESFVAMINTERTARGLGPVDVYWDLVDDARAHSQLMSQEQILHHNPDLGKVTSGWISLGENVGVGPSVDTLHQAFMDSAGHRANILGDFNFVGVGVVAEAAEMMWVTVVFMKGPEDLLAPAETTTTTTTTTEAPPPPPPPAEPVEPQPAPEPEPAPVPVATTEPAQPPAPSPATPAPAPTPAPETPQMVRLQPLYLL